MTTLGSRLATALVERGVERVFGIPGVHTLEFYRGLADSGLDHVLPRHEQGAAFMADGYARSSGKPGVLWLISGPGLTNALTAMAQARADSIPMLVISAVNARDTLGRGLGHLHELPDQQALARTIALDSHRIDDANSLAMALDSAFERFASSRPGPVHIEIPLDVAACEQPEAIPVASIKAQAVCDDSSSISKACDLLNSSRNPVVIVGGGARRSTMTNPGALQMLAETLDAPLISTINARGAIAGHPLSVPASPSLATTRHLLDAADVVLCIGSELGATDFDMYESLGAWSHPAMIRVDIDKEQPQRHPAALPIRCDADKFLAAVQRQLQPGKRKGSIRAETARQNAWRALDLADQQRIELLRAIRDAIPGLRFVGDSTRLVYSGNLFFEPEQSNSWFNSATGFGTLGYAIPAAIGASLAQPDRPVLALIGDGGAQFSIGELIVAAERQLPIVFLIDNNAGYGEIEASMRAAAFDPIACSPQGPDWHFIARAMRLAYALCDASSLPGILRSNFARKEPALIELRQA